MHKSNSFLISFLKFFPFDPFPTFERQHPFLMLSVHAMGTQELSIQIGTDQGASSQSSIGRLMFLLARGFAQSDMAAEE